MIHAFVIAACIIAGVVLLVILAVLGLLVYEFIKNFDIG